MNEQLDLFEQSDIDWEKEKKKKQNKLKPRNEQVPIYEPKSTQAIYSSFGWLFQVVAAIVLSLVYIDDLKEVKVEGRTEDIELYFKHKPPIYVQAKSTSGDLNTTNVAKNCVDALNTLINTSNLHEEYSQLIYISNYINPLNLKSRIADSLWHPMNDKLLCKNYSEIYSEGQKYLLDRSLTAQKHLKEGGYLSNTDNFKWDKLSVASLILQRTDEKNKRYEVLEQLVKLKLGKHQNIVIENNIIDLLLKNYHENATACQVTITKDDLFWMFIVKYIEFAPDDFLDQVNIMRKSKVKSYSEGFLENQILNTRIINRIMYDFKIYESGNNSNDINVFLDKEWMYFKEDFPVEEEEIQKDCIKNMIYQVLYKIDAVKDLKEGFKINDFKENKDFI